MKNHEATVAKFGNNQRTFSFSFTHKVFGNVTGIASIPTNVHWSELTVDDIHLKSLANNLSVINMEIINYPELKAAKFHALNELTIKQASKNE